MPIPPERPRARPPIIAVVLAVLAALVLAAAVGCSGDDGSASPSSATSSATPGSGPAGSGPSATSGPATAAPTQTGTSVTDTTSLPARCAGTTPVPVDPTGPTGQTGQTGPTGKVDPNQLSLRGRVVDGVCRNAVAGVAVWAYAADEERDPIASAGTDADGRYTFTLPRGRYKLGFQIKAQDYAFVWYADGQDFGSAREIELRGPLDLADVALYRPEDQPVPGYEGEGHPRIAVIGDSLVQGGATQLRRQIGLIGPTSVRGIANQRIAELQPVAERYAATDPDIVVIALGNNDANQGTPLTESVRDLTTMITAFPAADCVVILDVNTHTPRTEFNDPAAAFNAALPAVAASHPKVRLAGWDATVAFLLASGANTTWFTDGLHLTTEGTDVFAKVMTQAIDTC